MTGINDFGKGGVFNDIYYPEIDLKKKKNCNPDHGSTDDTL